MKMKAEMGHWSSVVGNSVHLLAEDGRMIGQIAFLCHDDTLRDKDVQERLARIICEAINSTPLPACMVCGNYPEQPRKTDAGWTISHFCDNADTMVHEAPQPTEAEAVEAWRGKVSDQPF